MVLGGSRCECRGCSLLSFGTRSSARRTPVPTGSTHTKRRTPGCVSGEAVSGKRVEPTRMSTATTACSPPVLDRHDGAARSKAASSPLPQASAGRERAGGGGRPRMNKRKLQLQIPTSMAVEPNYADLVLPAPASELGGGGASADGRQVRSAPLLQIAVPGSKRKPPKLSLDTRAAAFGGSSEEGGGECGAKDGGEGKPRRGSVLNLPTLATRGGDLSRFSPRRSSSSPQLRGDASGGGGGASGGGERGANGGGAGGGPGAGSFHSYGLLSKTGRGATFHESDLASDTVAAAAVAARLGAGSERQSRHRSRRRKKKRAVVTGGTAGPSPLSSESRSRTRSASGSPPTEERSLSPPLPEAGDGGPCGATRRTCPAGDSTDSLSSLSQSSPDAPSAPVLADDAEPRRKPAGLVVDVMARQRERAGEEGEVWEAGGVAMLSSGRVSPDRRSPSSLATSSGSIVISSGTAARSPLRRSGSVSGKNAFMLGAVGIASPSSVAMDLDGLGFCGEGSSSGAGGEGDERGPVGVGWSAAQAADTMTPTELVTKMQALAAADEDYRLLIIDMRSFFIFERNHIVGAVNISLPRALTSKNITLDRVEVLITSEHGKSAFRDRASRTVVIYDDYKSEDGVRPSDSLARLLAEEGEVANVFLLEGGFSNFESLHPDVCAKQQSSWLETSSDDDGPMLSPYVVRMVAPTGTNVFSGSSNVTSTLLAAAAGSGATRGGGGGPSGASARDTGFPSEIIDGELFLGSERNASNLRALTLLNVEAILNMATECANHFPLHFVYHSIDIFDDPDVIVDPYLDAAADFIHASISAGQATFVHCFMGVSRSATVTLVYLMKHRGMTLQAAYDLVKARRPKVCPNSGFMAALIRYEKALFGSVSLDAEEYAPFLLMETMPETPRAVAGSGPATPRAAFAFPDVGTGADCPATLDPDSPASADAVADAELARASMFEDRAESKLLGRRASKKFKRKPSKSTTISSGSPSSAPPPVPSKKSARPRPALILPVAGVGPPPVTPRGGGAPRGAFS